MSTQDNSRTEEPSGKVAEYEPVIAQPGEQAMIPTGQTVQPEQSISEELRQERLKRWQKLDDRQKIR